MLWVLTWDLSSLKVTSRHQWTVFSTVRGPWSRTAAEVALAGTDKDVTDYIRTGWTQAAQQDDRTRVENLALLSEIEPVRAQAVTALSGDAIKITSFLETGQYAAASDDFRVQIAQIISKGGPNVQESGRAALNSGSEEKYRQFLVTGQFTAQYDDDRLIAAGLADGGSTAPDKCSVSEATVAACIALKAPAQALHEFALFGQLKAKRKDLLAATHDLQISKLIQDAAKVAATAQENADRAQAVAADARKAATEADKYRKQAEASKNKAQGYANQAAESAKQATESANRAAESAKKATEAEAQARQSAREASHSAALAESSATAARGSADEAWSYANEAKQSAIAAGKDSDAADKAAKDALAVWMSKSREEAEAAREEENRESLAALQEMEEAMADAAADDETSVWDVLSGVGHTALDVAGLIPAVGEVADLANAGWYGLEGDALNASLSAAAAIPVAGWGATGAKWGKNAYHGAEAFIKAQKALGGAPHIWAANKKFPHAQNAAKHWSKHKSEFPELAKARDYVELAHAHRGALSTPKPPNTPAVDRDLAGGVIESLSWPMCVLC
ncbi:hypothetical protein V1460_04110 [Streptomyces sp. SCSIO 30461]|uniref:hypothetical protein n=1 Tax=Streptomyces sp. SCSIO 30461 TaxID=3118085 RepID=UPI0030D20C31